MPQGPELHLDLSGQKEPVLTPGRVYAPQGPELHLDLSGQKEPVLTPGRVYAPQGPELHAWTFLDYRSLCCSCTYLHYMSRQHETLGVSLYRYTKSCS
jgi:hypothetical protein